MVISLRTANIILVVVSLVILTAKTLFLHLFSQPASLSGSALGLLVQFGKSFSKGKVLGGLEFILDIILHMQLRPWAPPCVLFGWWFSPWEIWGYWLVHIVVPPMELQTPSAPWVLSLAPSLEILCSVQW